jgi:hypothetical protein
MHRISSLGSSVGRHAAGDRGRSVAQPPIGSTWQLGSVPRHGRLSAVSLGRGPSLHDLHRKLPSFVRSFGRYYDLIRLLIRVHARRIACDFPSRPGTSPDTGETSQVPCKELPHVRKVYDCARFAHASQYAMGRCCLLFSRMRSAPRNWTRFAARYLARGLPVNASLLPSRAEARAPLGSGGWLDLSRGGLSIPCELSWRTLLRVTSGHSGQWC